MLSVILIVYVSFSINYKCHERTIFMWKILTQYIFIKSYFDLVFDDSFDLVFDDSKFKCTNIIAAATLDCKSTMFKSWHHSTRPHRLVYETTYIRIRKLLMSNNSEIHTWNSSSNLDSVTASSTLIFLSMQQSVKIRDLRLSTANKIPIKYKIWKITST